MKPIDKKIISAEYLRELMNEEFHKIDRDFKDIFFLTPSMSGFNHLDNATDNDWGIGTATGDFLQDDMGNVLSSIKYIDDEFKVYAQDEAMKIWAQFACIYNIE